MTDKEIEALAEGYIAADWHRDRYYRDMDLIAFATELTRLATLVEREACAKVCEVVGNGDEGWTISVGEACADQIRKRSNVM